MELLERCTVLKNYMYFVDMVRFYREQLGNLKETLEQAIEMAIDDCIRNHILEDFFRSRRAEVIKVTLLDFTWERREELIRKEEYEEGVAAVLQVIEKLKQGIEPEELIAQGADEEMVRKAMALL